jgi:hypothetical protein
LIYLALSDQGIARLPIRDNIKRRIRMVRQNKNIVNAPNDPNFTSIPTSLTKTVRDDMFLRCDTGPGMSFKVTDILFNTTFRFWL